MTAVEAPTRADAAGVPRARQMLERARWAGHAFARYDQASVLRIAEAVTRVAEDQAEAWARAEVEATGRGVVADRAATHRRCSRGILDAHRDHDFVTPRVDEARGIVELPRPAGVVLAVAPSTNPVAMLLATAVAALLTRNAVVVCPHPSVPPGSADVVLLLAEAAVAAGAPDGVIQLVATASEPVLDALTGDERVDVVARNDRPGNVPVLVDATADLRRAAVSLVESQAFDCSLLSGSESVLVVEDSVADALLRELEQQGAHVLDPAERDRVRDALFGQGHFDASLAGQDAATVAARAGVVVGARTRLLLAPIDQAVDEEPLAHRKPCPVLGVVRVPTAHRGLRTAAAVVRLGGGGSAVVHSTDPRAVMEVAAALGVLQVVVNEGGSTGSAGLATHLAASPRPEDLVRTTRIAYGHDASEVLPSFAKIDPGSTPVGPVPPYPVAGTVGRGSDRESSR